MSRALSSSGEDVKRSPPAQLTPTTTLSAASAMLATSSTAITRDVLPLPSLFLTAQSTHSSTVSDAPATSVSSRSPSMLALPALQELPGTVSDVKPPSLLFLSALLAMSTTKTSSSASPQLPHVVTTPSSTEPLASALMDSTGSAECARSVLTVLSSMVLSAHPWLFLPPSLVEPTRSLSTEHASATVDFI